MRLTSLVGRALLFTPAPQLRAPSIVARGNETLTVGDALAGSLQKALRDLPAEQQKLRAELAINSMLDASTAELDQLQLDLARKLFKKESEVTDALQKNLTATVRLYLTTLNKTAVKLDAALAPSREGVRFELNKALAEQAAREEAKRRAIAASGGLRLSWRDERALAEYKAQEKKHPIVMVCEASALCISLLIVLALGDAASGRHELTNPMKGAEVRRVTLQKPRRTTDALVEKGVESFPPVEEELDVNDLKDIVGWDELKTAAKTPASAASAAAPVQEAGKGQWHDRWVTTLRCSLAVYLTSLATILARSGTDDWAARAIGIKPVSEMEGDNGEWPGGNGRRPPTGFVQWVYDWERDTWREAGADERFDA